MIKLSEILGVDEGVIFKLIGLKGRVPEDLYMILDNQLFLLDNLSSRTPLENIFLHDIESDELIVKPMFAFESCEENECENNKIGFVPNHYDETEEDTKIECEDNSMNDNIDFNKFIKKDNYFSGLSEDYLTDLRELVESLPKEAIDYLGIVVKNSIFYYITKDYRDNLICLHESEPFAFNDFWDSNCRIKNIDVIAIELFDALPCNRYFYIDDIIEMYNKLTKVGGVKC